ncbi:MAG TPA: hypothetical protein PLJ34_00400 [Hyphomicrobiales bacterium]|nr:hypothetical protein [Hyphomicrobiales bacterium]
MLLRKIVVTIGVLAATAMPAAAASLVVPFEAPSDVIEVEGLSGMPGPWGQERYDPPGISGAPVGEKYLNEPRPGAQWSPPPRPPGAVYGGPHGGKNWQHGPGVPPPIYRPRPQDDHYYGPAWPGTGYYYDNDVRPRPHIVTRVSVREVKAMLYDLGYNKVRFADDLGDRYLFKARDGRGRQVVIYVDAYTGEVIKVRRT